MYYTEFYSLAQVKKRMKKTLSFLLLLGYNKRKRSYNVYEKVETMVNFEAYAQQIEAGKSFAEFYQQQPEIGDSQICMLSAIRQSAENFQFASERLRSSIDFILQLNDAGISEEYLLIYAHPSVYYDERILYGLTSEEISRVYPMLGRNLRSQAVVALIALTGECYQKNISFIPHELWLQKDFAIRAVIAQGSLLVKESHLFSYYWQLPEFWWAAVQTDGLILKYAFYEYREDYEFVSAAVAQNGAALQYAACALQDDEKLVRLAMTTEPMAWRYASSRVQGLLAV